jgi:hypothetical protein
MFTALDHFQFGLHWFLAHTILNPPFRAFRIHTWSIEIEGNEPIVTEFPITQVQQQPPMFQAMPRMPRR